MSIILKFATISISLALVFYTLGVWGERKAKILKMRHLAFFWMGLVFDVTGTILMERIADVNAESANTISSSLHGITGLLAILLMLIHTIWASIVFYQNNDEKKRKFHKFSLLVWLLWLVPYLIGMINGMM